MNILLTNDDGYNSLGIKTLYTALQKYGKVYIIAPEHHMSGKSCSITITEGLVFKKYDEFIYSLDGTPADCVAYALGAFPVKFDLVVSGINDGLNISYDILYSGTIGACQQSLIYGIPTIAFSTNYKEKNFQAVADNLDKVMQFCKEKGLFARDFFANVNFPSGNEIKGIKLSHVYYRKDDASFVTKGDKVYAVRTCETEFKEKDSDCYLVEHGYISITPLSNSYFSKEIYDKIKKN